jgi:hypothetical protein
MTRWARWSWSALGQERCRCILCPRVIKLRRQADRRRRALRLIRRQTRSGNCGTVTPPTATEGVTPDWSATFSGGVPAVN